MADPSLTAERVLSGVLPLTALTFEQHPPDPASTCSCIIDAMTHPDLATPTARA